MSTGRMGTGTVHGARTATVVRLPSAGRICVPRGEVIACALGFGLLALEMCAAHVSHGGLYYDDWSLVALARFPGPGGLLHGLWLDYGQRPGQVLYYAALDETLGLGAGPRLALAAVMVVLQATCLYVLLRQLGLAVYHAVAIAALSLVFPFSDSVWLWGVLSLASLAIAAALVGVILAVRALQSTGRRALALHAASLLLYVVSVVSYEVFAVVGCLAGLLYVHVVGFSRARGRWLLDGIAIALTLAVARGALPIDVATPSRTQSIAGMAVHAGLIAHRGVRLIGAAALPVGGLSPWLGAGLLAAAIAAAAVLRMRLAGEEPVRAELGRWLAIAGAGALVVIAGWAAYVPGPDHYLPSAAGTVNRMNAVAGVGIAILIYASVVLLARTLARLVRLPASAASPIIVAAALALGVAYLARAADDARAWDAAAADQRRLLADLHTALPRLPRESTVYAFGAPQVVGPGVPVLDTTLDLTSAMRVSYASPQLLGVPVAGAASVACGAAGPRAGGVTGIYGESYLFDAGARRAVPLLARAQCAAQLEGAVSGAVRRLQSS